MDRYDKNLILALEEINIAECGCRFTTTADLLDNVGNYVLHEGCYSIEEVVAELLKYEWNFSVPFELESYFDMDGYVRDYKESSGTEWFETEYGMVERLI